MRRWKRAVPQWRDSERREDGAMDRMGHAGVTLSSITAIVGELAFRTLEVSNGRGTCFYHSGKTCTSCTTCYSTGT